MKRAFHVHSQSPLFNRRSQIERPRLWDLCDPCVDVLIVLPVVLRGVVHGLVPAETRVKQCRVCRATRATRRDMRNRRSFGFRVMPGRPKRPFRDNSRSGQLATKLLVEAISSPRKGPPRGAAARSPTATWDTPSRSHTLGLCSFNRGGGLDSVWQRGYGRLRWLDYPAKTNKDR